MRLVTFTPKSSPNPRHRLGALDRSGEWVVDLRVLLDDEAAPRSDSLRWLDLDTPWLAEALAAAAQLETAVASGAMPAAATPARLAVNSVRFGPAVPRPGKLICIGLNYRDHAAESNMPIPERPVVFSKFATSIVGPGDAIVLPGSSEKVDYEAELAVVMGRRAKHVSRSRALDYVLGYTNLNDVSARDFQFADGQWQRGKSCDTFAPMGPAIVTAEDVPDPQTLAIALRVNGETLQSSSTAQMIFGVAELIAFLSETITLEPGDVIATGTPPGVGFARKPPVFLKAGDVVEVEVEGLGVLRNPVVAAE